MGDTDYVVGGAILFGMEEDFFEPLDRINCDHQSIQETVLAFRQNLLSASDVGAILFRLVHSSIINQRFNNLHIAAKIRARKFATSSDEETPKEHLAEARNIAMKQLHEELSQPEVISKFVDQTIGSLNGYLSDDEFRRSSDELMRQIAVMCWGAFEVLSTDILRTYLNLKPQKTIDILSTKKYREIVFGRNLMSMLSQNNFDLSSAMGDVFFEEIKIDSLEKIQELYNIAFCNGDLDAALKNERLWLLSQQRHLIVHRRSVIDARYLSKTSDKAEIGSRLQFTSDYVETLFYLSRDTGVKMIETINENLQ